MSQINKGLENEYLVPYLSFTTNPSGQLIGSGGTANFSVVAAASTGIGYLTYKWYQDGSQIGSATTASSGVATTKDVSLVYSGSSPAREVEIKVGASWTPQNSDLIVSHGTPGVGATGVGVGQSITGNAASGEVFSTVGIISVAPTIGVAFTAIGIQPVGFNTSAFDTSRTITVDATIGSGDNDDLAYQWKKEGTNISGATTTSYTFIPGSDNTGVTTYTVNVSYPSNSYVPDVESSVFTDNAVDPRQIVRIEVYPAGGSLAYQVQSMVGFDDSVGNPNEFSAEADYPNAKSQGFTDRDIRYYLTYVYDKAISNSMNDKLADASFGPLNCDNTDYKVYSREYNLADYTDGLKIDVTLAKSIVGYNAPAGETATSPYYDEFYYIGIIPTEEDILVDLELGGTRGISRGGRRGGDGGWTVLRGTLLQNKEYFAMAANTGGALVEQQRIPSACVYELGTVIGVSGNGGDAGDDSRGGDGGADSPGENTPGGSSGGAYYSPNTLPVVGMEQYDSSGRGRMAGCPSGLSWYQTRYTACQTFTDTFRDPYGISYCIGEYSENSLITRGFKNGYSFTLNGAYNVGGYGAGGSGADGGSGDDQHGGAGGSGYYGGNWTKKASVRGGNDGSNRTWEYDTNLNQTVSTDNEGDGYIRIFGRSA